MYLGSVMIGIIVFINFVGVVVMLFWVMCMVWIGVECVYGDFLCCKFWFVLGNWMMVVGVGFVMVIVL